MKISPLTVHCASLCLDVVNRESFEKLTIVDIEGWQDELYAYIENLFAREPYWILEKMQRKIALSYNIYINNSDF